MVNLNKEIKISKYKVNSNTYNVIRDDFLKGGTKQRAIEVFLEKEIDEYIYAGPTEGYAQIALAYLCKLHKKKAILFVSGQKKSHLTKKAQDLGAKIFFKKYTRKIAQKKAQEYEKSHPKSKLLPFGLESPEFLKMLKKNIKKAFPKDIQSPKRMWLVAGSGTILKALQSVFPKTKFQVVQVGKKIWPDQLRKKDTLYISSKKFWEIADPLPPYPSVSTYDAKLWEFVEEYGKDEDYIWNVAKD